VDGVSVRPAPVWIVERRVVLVHPDGRRVDGHIRIGRPYTLGGGDPTGNFESHCPIEIEGLYPSDRPMIGGGTLSALIHGIEMTASLLRDFVADGGRVLDPADDADLPLSAMFGALWDSDA
jgi:hypothetical protein